MSLDKSKLNTDTFCIAPWVQMHFSVQKDVLPCCVYERRYSLGNLMTTDNLEEIYNSEVSKNLRKDLFEGRKNIACEACWLSEKISKNESYRLDQNRNLKNFINSSLENTNDDFSLKEIKIHKLDIRFDNKCNLKCRICSAEYSTSWYSDTKKIQEKGNKYFSHIDLSDGIYKETVNDTVYDFILSQLEYVQEIFFAGGEPLIQDKHYEILQTLIDKDLSKNVIVTYNTNFSKLNYRNFKIFEIWKKFKRVNVCASLDDSYERGEYQRKNINWDEVVSNIKLLKKENLKNTSFSLIPTLSIFNAYHILDFHKEWLESGYIQGHDFSINILEGPTIYSIKNLPKDIKLELIKKYKEYIKYLEKNISNYDEMDVTINEFDKCVNYFTLNLEHNSDELESLFEFNEFLDKIRGESFKKTFPEYSGLKKYYLNNVI